MVALLALPATARAEEPCKTLEVEYVLAGNLRLSDTPMGQGDGTYRIGPGRALIRFEGDRARLLAYTMEQRFTIHPSALFWRASLVTNMHAGMREGATVDGAFDGHIIRWSGGMPYFIDGTMQCTGSLCGKFGAPRSGTSPISIPAYTQALEPFVFSNDGQTFTMQSTPGPHTTSPKQTSEVSVAGREIKRVCVAP